MSNIPIKKKWSNYTKINVRRVSNVFGMYELADGRGHIIYIGEGKLQDRLIAHFSNGSDPIPGASLFRYTSTGGKKKAVQNQNSSLSKIYRTTGNLPRFNQKRRG